MQPIEKTVASILSKFPPPGTTNKTCIECQNEFLAPPGRDAIYATRCEGCEKAWNEKRKAAVLKDSTDRRKAAWEKICPLDYRDIDRALLPAPEKLDEILCWKFGRKGLVLHGETGRGKTRCAWALLAREFSGGLSVGILDSMAGLRYASKYNTSAGEVETWIDRLIKNDILLLDDVFKNKLTDSFEGVIFSLVDQRIQNRLPTIITCNDTGPTLAARMSQDRGNPFLRRLREDCTAIHF